MAQAFLKKEQVVGLSNLPTLPEVASKLLQIVNDPETSAAEVANLISKDIGITSKVLRMANSAFYGIPRTITTVQSAVVLLGMKVINSLVLSVSVGSAFPKSEASNLLGRKDFWRHSLACAIGAKLCAIKIQESRLIDPEQCFCAGLLHDIGKLVLDYYFTDKLKLVMEAAKEQKISLLDAEKQVLGCFHVDVSDWLTSKWELPEDLRVSIIFHHSPASAPTLKEGAFLLNLADSLSHELGYQSYQNEVFPSPHPDCLNVLNLGEKEIESIKAKIPEEMENLEASLSFEQIT